MQIFDIVEELEKERKKNKELEERNGVLEKGCKKYRYHIKQMNKIHDNCLNTIEELQDRIDSAINNIEKVLNMYEEVKDKELLTNGVVHIECYKELYDLLKGDNK